MTFILRPIWLGADLTWGWFELGPIWLGPIWLEPIWLGAELTGNPSLLVQQPFLKTEVLSK